MICESWDKTKTTTRQSSLDAELDKVKTLRGIESALVGVLDVFHQQVAFRAQKRRYEERVYCYP